jgi:hypothetical protein
MRRPSFLLMAIAFVSCIALAKGVQQVEFPPQEDGQNTKFQALEDAERTLVPLVLRESSLDLGSGGTPWRLPFQR